MGDLHSRNNVTYSLDTQADSMAYLINDHVLNDLTTQSHAGTLPSNILHR